MYKSTNKYIESNLTEINVFTSDVRQSSIMHQNAKFFDLSEHIEIYLTWILGHHEIGGNEKADKLTLKGSHNSSAGPEPYMVV